jgi:hypothetical protein
MGHELLGMSREGKSVGEGRIRRAYWEVNMIEVYIHI